MDLTNNAKSLLEERYLKKRGEGSEAPRELFRRVARAVAAADLYYSKSTDEVCRIEDEFCRMMSDLEFLPNSPTLLNAGSRFGQLSACFVLPIEDSMKGIFTALKDAAEIHKSGGGTGFSFAKLRSSDSKVEGCKASAKGPLAYLELYNQAMDTVEQGGVRRGGNMGVLRVDHPDILEFINCKSREGDLSNFNISVTVTDAFMEALANDGEYDLVDPHSKARERCSARKVWEALTNAAHSNGEPGVIFIDTINKTNPTPEMPLEATNPCGEQPLLPYESCNLGSINLSKFVKNRGIDYPRLKTTVANAIHFFDNVIDVNYYPLPRLKEMAEMNRKVGLGVMGFADMLIALNVPYNSENALRLAGEIMTFIEEAATQASQDLAKERGAFPNFPTSTYADGPAMRNATVTTIAPTGSISMIAGCSSGVEPLFAISYRNTSQSNEYRVVNPLFENTAKTEGFYSEDLMTAIDERRGSVQGIDGVPASMRELFVTAADIAPEWHVKIQAEFQKHVGNAVSKTVNMPNSATVSDIAELYQLAWKSGCKGVTIYRDGSRTDQPLTAENNYPSGKCSL